MARCQFIRVISTLSPLQHVIRNPPLVGLNLIFRPGNCPSLALILSNKLIDNIPQNAVSRSYFNINSFRLLLPEHFRLDTLLRREFFRHNQRLLPMENPRLLLQHNVHQLLNRALVFKRLLVPNPLDLVDDLSSSAHDAAAHS